MARQFIIYNLEDGEIFYLQTQRTSNVILKISLVGFMILVKLVFLVLTFNIYNISGKFHHVFYHMMGWKMGGTLEKI